jgi:hypothetical protein
MPRHTSNMRKPSSILMASSMGGFWMTYECFHFCCPEQIPPELYHSDCKHDVSDISGPPRDRPQPNTRQICMERQRISSCCTRQLLERKNNLEAQELGRNWGCGIPAAEQTLRATTQKGIQTIHYLSLAKRLNINDWQLRYKCLHGTQCSLTTSNQH